ncbi:MAG TPA: hypothetical protein VM432_02420 [Bdellovibrionales bacterium]|nr:hypothetical protein [Bdellovibrionales bacterium]
MDKKQVEEFCQDGERADTYLRQGRPRDALKIYLDTIAKLESQGQIDSYLMAKITLGVLRCHVKLGDFKNAYTIWNADVEEGLFGIGIYALESAQTTVHDMITYDMICAFLHTLAEADEQESAAAVNQYLSRVCEHAIDEADRKTLRMAVSNWKQHLRDIFRTSVPHDAAKPLIHFERQLGETVKPAPIDFPLPTPWEKPHDFMEMSRVVQMKSKPKDGKTQLRRNRVG